jgi:hypothetical protein
VARETSAVVSLSTPAAFAFSLRFCRDVVAATSTFTSGLTFLSAIACELCCFWLGCSKTLLPPSGDHGGDVHAGSHRPRNALDRDVRVSGFKRSRLIRWSFLFNMTFAPLLFFFFLSL